MKTLRPSRLTPLPLLGALLLLGAMLVPRPAWAGDNVWTPIGPYGGDVRAIAFHPSRPALVWAGTDTSGVFRSTDGGATWRPMNRGLPAPVRSVRELEVSAAGSLTVYAIISNTLYRSVGGGPWEERSSQSGFVREISADPYREGVLWSGGVSREGAGIDRSNDGGATWTRVLTLDGGAEGSNPTGFVFAPGDPSALYTGLLSSNGAQQGVLRSRDGGETWEDASDGIDLPEQGSVSVRLEIAPDTGVLFAAVEWHEGAPALGFRLYRSADRGDTWTLVLPGGEDATAGPGGLVLTRNGYRSLDGGLDWAPLLLPGGEPPLLEVHPAAPGTVFAAPNRNGLLRSTDSAVTWRLSQQGITAAQALDLVADPILPGTLYASVAGGGLFKTDRGGTVWERLFPGDRSFIFSMIDELAAAASGGETTLYAISSGDGPYSVVRSEDSGTSWEELGRPGDGSLQTLAVDPKAPRTVYLGSDAIRQCPAHRSSDGGETWSCMPLSDTFELVVDPRRPANLWAISRTLFRSTDRGRTWKAANRGLGDAVPQILTIDPSNSETVWLGSWNGLFKTTDGGRTWTSSGKGLPPAGRLIAVAVHPRNSAIVYAGFNHQGVYRSTDGGRRWTRLQRELPTDFTGPLVIDPHDPRTLYAGTEARGFYAITVRR